ncbi:MAG: hypothetical protein E7350_01480 [Clostridiales bacterium]|nr:hypothetical protein [Clostridiales bacterium]
MINFISAVEGELTFLDAVIVLAIGMAVIFVTLTVLIGLLHVIRLVVSAIEKPKQAPAAPTASQTAEIQEDEETVAAITAAITCILMDEAQSEGNDEPVVAPFRIKKIKHIH